MAMVLVVNIPNILDIIIITMVAGEDTGGLSTDILTTRDTGEDTGGPSTDIPTTRDTGEDTGGLIRNGIRGNHGESF
ncbi:MAG: hypothetical protein DSM106950_44840 [Stigonema ocellatum SAG 48.90 = DSM 106950]|nr:hypothetical protein [Stigonema ocellatum SAG 48.90 = DSM 106950]